MKKNNKYLIKTPNGFKKFEGISRSIFNIGLKFTFLDKTSISVTEDHLFKHEDSYKKAEYFKVGDKIQNKEIIKIEKINGDFYEPVEVEGHEYMCNDLIHHNCSIIYVDEVAFVANTDWQGIVDSVLPSQSALIEKQFIATSTPNGMNHWYHLVQQAKKENSGYEFFTMDWREVPRYNKDGTKADPEEYKEKQIKKNGKKWFAQNFELAFLGSSSTLINEEALKSFEPLTDDEVIFNSLFDGLRILEEPKRLHNYIIGVDPAKEGIDKTAIQVFDVTSLPFKQVACCNLDDSYLKVPGKLFDLGNYYNQAMIVVENNIDNSIVDTLFYHYDYEGEIYKEKVKNILGFRTTIKTKKILLSVLKKLIEENKLIIKDKETINEFFVFIEQKNGSFAAEEGYHDDLVMACMIALAPFIDIKSFDDFKGFISLVEKRNEELEAEEAETELFYSMGFSTELTDEDVEDTKNKNFSNLSYF